jgi:hypothetical protein
MSVGFLLLNVALVFILRVLLTLNVFAYSWTCLVLFCKFYYFEMLCYQSTFYFESFGLFWTCLFILRVLIILRVLVYSNVCLFWTCVLGLNLESAVYLEMFHLSWTCSGLSESAVYLWRCLLIFESVLLILRVHIFESAHSEPCSVYLEELPPSF